MGVFMQHYTSAVLILALISGSSAHAASDTGLTLHDEPSALGPRGGVGAQVSVTIRLGDKRNARASDKVTFGLAAGPMLSIPTRNAESGSKRRVAGLATFSLKPGYSSTLSLGGQPVLQNYTQLGAAEAETKEGGTAKQKKKQSTGDKIAWTAAVAGGVMVVLIGAAAIALSNYCYECGD